VIVIGGGPSGATAASHLAGSGHSVLVLEKGPRGRSKPCAGGLTAQAVRELGFHLPSSVLGRPIYALRLVCCGRTREVRRKEPFMWVTRRDLLDLYLLDNAARAGATVRNEEVAIDISRTNAQVTVTTRAGSYSGRLLILASGVRSGLVRKAGFSITTPLGWCTVASIPTPHTDPGDTVLVEYDFGGKGYGWAFPGVGHMNIGYGCHPPFASQANNLFESFIQRHGLPKPQARAFWPVPLGGGRRFALTADSALVVGDAAGMVDPFTGEGLRYAFRSGRLAAEVAAAALSAYGYPPKSDLSYYDQACRVSIFRELEAARRVVCVASKFHRLFEELMLRPGMAESIQDLLSGQVGYGSLAKRGLLCMFSTGSGAVKRPEATTSEVSQGDGPL